MSKRFVKKNRNVLDIVLFGSMVRGKILPEDIDICLIGLKVTEAQIKEFENLVNKIDRKVHISYLPLDNFLDPKQTLWKTIFHEGYSLVKNRNISKLIGFDSFVIFWYNLKTLEQKDKVRFYYALSGRDGSSGILKQVKGLHLGKGVIAVPLKNEDKIRNFFMNWKIPFNRRRILLEV